MTMDKIFHPTDDKERLYVSREEGGREFSSIEYYIDAYTQLGDNFKKSKER